MCLHMNMRSFSQLPAISFAALSLAIPPATLRGQEPSAAPAAVINLLDASLSKWETFIGVPHSTVTGLPEGTALSGDVTKGTPLGLNNDPEEVFTTVEEEGTTVLRVSGEIYGCVTTKAEFANYHFKTEFKWGKQKWEPRLNAKRDSGILYHCTGDHGAFWNVWKSSLEYQVQETDLGDFYPLAGTACHIPIRTDNDSRFFDTAFPWVQTNKHVYAVLEPDKPHGEWNLLEIYVLGDTAIHLANGEVVFALKNATDRKGQSLVV